MLNLQINSMIRRQACVAVGVVGFSFLWTIKAWARGDLNVHGKPYFSLDQVSAPRDLDVCFSPEEPCDLKLIKFIDEAKLSLDIAIYDINLDQLVNHVLKQSKKIPVRILVDYRQSKGEHSAVDLLIRGGAMVRFGHQRGIMHNKFIIRDQLMVETGSFNFTNHASQANNENQIYLGQTDVVNRFVKRFQEIWTNGRSTDLGDAKKRQMRMTRRN